ncbi:MAG TPA: hypothetical protein VFG47_10500 [Geminicoccaceae bacterium]|nr:hypothetical protein [Geminicoccaceae bacterium]
MIGNVGSGPHAIGEDDLQAYVDGLLDVRRRSAVEAYLALYPNEAERVEAYRGQNVGLHALFDRYAAEAADAAPIEGLRHQLHATVTRQRLCRRVAGVAACLTLVLGAGIAGWSGIGLDRAPKGRDFVAAAPPEPIRAEDPHAHDPPRAAPGVVQAGLVGWLSQRVAGGRAEWPDLQPFGLALTGERLTATAGGLAVELVYRGPKGRQLALHIDLKDDDAPVAPPPVGEAEIALFWRSGPLVLSLIGEMERAELLGIAEAVSDQVALIGAGSEPPAGGQPFPSESLPTADATTSVGDGGGAQAAAPDVVQETGGAGAAVSEPVPEAAGEAATPGGRAPAARETPADDSGAVFTDPEQEPRPFSDLTPPRPIRAAIDPSPVPPRAGSVPALA